MKQTFRFERPAALLAAIMALPVLALVFAAGCHPNLDAVKTPVVAEIKNGGAEFVGNDACAACHNVEFTRHQHSGHAGTLWRADANRPGKASPPVGPIAGTPYAIRKEGGKLRFALNDNPEPGEAIEYALGSGKTAVTYVGALGADRLTEFRMSYDPADHKWFTTPGQVGKGDLKSGTVFERGMATRCILCHAVKLAPGRAEPADGFLGVGCESCHGPGSAHIAAVKSPQAAGLFMEKMGQWSAAKIDAMCARCHRSVNDIALDQYDASNTARFQPYSLELSPCFQKSGGKLSCITCHDPHADTSTDRRAYEKVCLSCHSTAANVHNTVCPVNPKEKCIGCHMPKRSIFPSAHVPLTIADHLIWAYRPKKQ